MPIMKRLLKWTIRVVGAAAVVVAAMLLVQIYVLPGWVRSQLVAQLGEIGLDEADVVVEQVGWTGAQLRNLRLSQDEWLSVDAAHVTYTLGQLVGGRIETLVLTGARLRLAYRDGRLEFEPLSKIEITGERAADRLPFDRFELRSSLLIVDLGRQQLAVPIQGTVERLEDEKISLDFAARVRDHPARLEAELALKPQRIEVTRARLEVTPRGLVVGDALLIPDPDSRITLAVGSAERPLILRWDGDDQRVEGGAIDVQLGAFDVSVAGDRWRTSPTAWRFGPGADEEPGLWFSAAAGGEGALSAVVHSTAPVQITADALQASAEHIGASIVAEFAGARPPQVEAVVQVQAGRLEHRDLGLVLSGIDVRLPVAINTSAAQKPQDFTISNISYKGREFPPLTGMAAAAREGLELTARWPLTSQATTDAHLQLAPGTFGATAKLPPTDLAGLKPLLGEFIDLTGVEIAGRVRGELAIKTVFGDLRPRLQIGLENVRYHNVEAQTTLDGVTGEIVLDNLNPLTTPGGQRLRIERLQQGKIELTDGTIAFRVESPDRLFIEETDWTLGQAGRITAHAIRYDRDMPIIETELFIDDLNLEDWLSVLTDEKVTATGKLYGRVPLRIRARGGRYQVAFGEGFLYSTPGPAGTGTLRIPDAAEVSRMLAQADPRFTTEPQLVAVRDRLASALTDFEYSMFRFDLIPREDRSVTLRARTRGKGRGPDGQEVDNLTININNFGQAANMALFGQWLLGEGIEQRLEEFFSPVEGAE